MLWLDALTGDQTDMQNQSLDAVKPHTPFILTAGAGGTCAALQEACVGQKRQKVLDENPVKIRPIMCR